MSGYDIIVDDRLVLPRGVRHTVTGIVEKAGSRLAVADARSRRQDACPSGCDRYSRRQTR